MNVCHYQFYLINLFLALLVTFSILILISFQEMNKIKIKTVLVRLNNCKISLVCRGID